MCEIPGVGTSGGVDVAGGVPSTGVGGRVADPGGSVPVADRDMLPCRRSGLLIRLDRLVPLIPAGGSVQIDQGVPTGRLNLENHRRVTPGRGAACLI